MAGGGGGDSTQISKVEPWGASEDMLKQGLFGLAEWYNANAPYDKVYRGQRVAPFADQQNQAFNMVQNIATDPSYSDPIKNMATGRLTGQGTDAVDMALLQAWDQVISPTMSGDYMKSGSNPFAADYLKSIIDPMETSFKETVLPTINANAEQAGVAGSGITALQKAKAAEGLAKQEANATTDFYNNMYNQERQNQMTATNFPANMYQFVYGQIPEYAQMLQGAQNQQFTNAGNLAGVGETIQGQNQAQIGADMQLFNENFYNPLDFINAYLQSAYQLGGNFKTTNQTGQLPGSSLAQMLAGGGAAGTGLAGMLGLF